MPLFVSAKTGTAVPACRSAFAPATCQIHFEAQAVTISATETSLFGIRLGNAAHVHPEDERIRVLCVDRGRHIGRSDGDRDMGKSFLVGTRYPEHRVYRRMCPVKDNPAVFLDPVHLFFKWRGTHEP